MTMPRINQSVTMGRNNAVDDAIGPANARHKIVVMGSAKVGKTSIITQFLYNTFSTKYKRTIEEMHQGNFSIAGVSLTLDILDTAGSYEFPAMRALSISSADAFILVYDVTDATTFEEVRTIRDQIHETKATTAVPIVVVGNKIDLLADGETEREVIRHHRIGGHRGLGEWVCRGLGCQQREHHSGVQGAAGPGEDHLQSESGPASSSPVIAAADWQQWAGHTAAPPSAPQPPPPVAAAPPQFRRWLLRLNFGGGCSGGGGFLRRRIPCPHSCPAAAPPANPGAEFGRQAQLVQHLLKERIQNRNWHRNLGIRKSHHGSYTKRKKEQKKNIT
ncbi:uncharacterized protein LOC128265927 isoform X2 [Drosophila gunungcola]|uniref:uncharacterized protein LOC128265927 isoform X2 n=1 Tax=Drosophila gunungcola TaxID=103775 RepID=UPI0022E4283B|nr:uncharacterized protein LOC128265927 isoform X2 [Drosophila gunungcola]